MSILHKLALAALAPLGFYTLHGLSDANGLFDTMTKGVEARVLPDGSTPFPSWVPDNPGIVGGLLGFFWPVVSGESAKATLLGLAFAGGSVATWAVMMVEGWRLGNKGSVASFITIYGLLFQVMGIGVIGPAFLALSLFLSPTASSPTASNLAVRDTATLKALPLALLAGFVIPTICMSLPRGVVSAEYKAAAILLWQIFPLYTTATTYSFGSLFQSEPAQPGNYKAQLPLLRRLYGIALFLATASHITVLALAFGGPSMFRPGADGPAKSELTLAAIFLPTLSQERISTMIEGAVRFLQWDYAIAVAGQMIWAVAQTSGLGPLRPVEVYRKELGYSVGSVWLDIVVRSVSLGPLGAALTLIWERDEIVLSGADVGKN